MLKNIAFVGGIHGVGKSTVCKMICLELGIGYLSASQILKWDYINPTNTKSVSDISHNQNLLISGLSNISKSNDYYLLDGHYSLMNSQNLITKIPFDTFQIINPISLGIVIGNISEIKERLEKRDNQHYDYDILEEMQKIEIDYAHEIAEKLRINLNISDISDYSSIKNDLQIKIIS